jgi:hypothetical protein
MLPKIQEINAKVYQSRTEVTTMYKHLLELEQDALPRKGNLNPSMLPLCSTRVLLSWLHHNLDIKSDKISYTGDIFMSVGTNFHTVIANWASKLNVPEYKLWGDWTCPNCNHKWSATENKICSNCGSEGIYAEVRIKHKGFSLYIDLVLITEFGVIVGDYKTATMNKLRKSEFMEYKSPYYAVQVFIYAYLLDDLYGNYFKKTYGLSITQTSLFFISRDIPFNSVEWSWSGEYAIKQGKEIAMQSLKAFLASQQSYITRNPDLAIQHQECIDIKQYNREVKPYFYGGCLFADFCHGNSNEQKKEHITNLFKRLLSEKDKKDRSNCTTTG